MMDNNENQENTHLKELSKSKFEVVEGSSNISGWIVKNEEGRILGDVDELIFDTESETVKYIVLDLEGNEMQLKERKVMLPLEMARLDEPFKNVIYPGAMANELTALPTYSKGKFYSRTEDLIHSAFSDWYKDENKYPSNNTATIPGADAAGGSDIRENRSTVDYGFEEGSAAGVTGNATPATGASPTVVGIFDHTNQAQAAVEYLAKHGFSRDRIEISLREDENYDTTPDNERGKDDQKMHSFFSSLFDDEHKAKDYTDAAKIGSVVTFHAYSMDDAEKAAEILDNHGAVNIDERYKPQGIERTSISSEIGQRRFNSMIVEKPEDGRVRGLR